ncbi:MAG: hypothetical protein M5U09_30420, partial [Gammaproteobacteria bacterium]|nr:hypothetical protein [Gammaproteobacteria bacterium]
RQTRATSSREEGEPVSLADPAARRAAAGGAGSAEAARRRGGRWFVCGIAGFVDRRAASPTRRCVLGRMTAAVTSPRAGRRGPLERRRRVPGPPPALHHRPRGQPPAAHMNEDGQVVVVFNGRGLQHGDLRPGAP